MLPLGQREEGLFSRPDAPGGLKGGGAAGDISMLSACPSPSPLESLKWAVLLSSKGVLQNHSSGVPEWIVTERHHDGWCYKLVSKSVCLFFY